MGPQGAWTNFRDKLSILAAMSGAVAAGSSAIAQAPAPPANMFMVCTASVRGGNTNYWSAFFEVKEPGHAMSAWKNLPGIFGVFSYGDMPFDYAERSMRLFAKEVMPALKAYQRPKVAAE